MGYSYWNYTPAPYEEPKNTEHCWYKLAESDIEK